MNKRQRKNRARRSLRAAVTQVTASLDAEKRRLQGFEGLYSVTAKGDIWSHRLNRYIKPTLSLSGEYTYFEFSVKGEKHRYTAGEAVANAWLATEQRKDLIARVPAEVFDPKGIDWNHPSLLLLAAAYDVPEIGIRHLVWSRYQAEMTKRLQERDQNLLPS